MTIHELEEVYFRLIYGEDKCGKGWEGYIHGFVESMVKKKEIIEEFNREIMEEWQDTNKSISSYLEFYEKRLIQEIRELKIKKIC